MFNCKPKNTSLNAEYQLFLNDEKIRLGRLLAVLGFLLYSVFALVDYWALPSAFHIAIYVRLETLFLIFLAFAFSYHSKFINYYSAVLTLNFIVIIGSIGFLIYLATPSDYAYNSYFSGFMIIMVALFSWTYLKLFITAFISIASILAYVGLELFLRDQGTDKVAVIMTNLFLLSGSVIFGFLAQVQRDRYLRQNFMMQKSLAKSYKEKAEEAKKHEYLANHDALTGLPNRRYMTELLEISMKTAEERGKVLFILFLDLNGFKQVNDIYGHAAGDKVLNVVAKRLELAIRSGDLVSRLGGDEYLIGLMVNSDRLDEADNIIEKYTAIISKPMNIEGTQIKVGTSIGLAAYPINGNNISTLIDIADKKMYDDKKGKARSALSQHTTLVGQDNKVDIFPGRKV